MRRLNDVFEIDKKRIRGRRHDFDIHLLLMKTASQNWTPYINDLEIEFRDMVSTKIRCLEIVFYHLRTSTDCKYAHRY
jgi:hypothetical protein